MEKRLCKLINSFQVLKYAILAEQTQIRTFMCPNYQSIQHIDLNASINIRNYGLGMLNDRAKIDKSMVEITQSYACEYSTKLQYIKTRYKLNFPSTKINNFKTNENF